MDMSLLTSSKFNSESSLFEKRTLSTNITIEMLEALLSNWYHTKKHFNRESIMRNSALLLSLLIGCTSEQMTKTINDAPAVAITSHSDGFEVFEGETLSFRAQASDTNNGTQAISVAWYLGQELVCDWATPLVAGDSFCDITFAETNTVVVEVRDEEGAAGRDEIAGNITANAAPEIEVLSPTEIERYYSDQLIYLSSSGF